MISMICAILYEMCCLGGDRERGKKEKNKTIFNHIIDNLEDLAEHEMEFIIEQFHQKKKKAKSKNLCCG